MTTLGATAQAASVGTSFLSNNGFAGNMFDVTNLSAGNITLDGLFTVNLSNLGSTNQIDVYYRSGSYVGFENSSLGWVLLGSDASVISQGQDNQSSVDVGNSFVIGAGETYSLYISLETYGSTSLRYTGTGGGTSVDDGTVQLDLGIGKGVGFAGATVDNRIWNGTLQYSIGGTLPDDGPTSGVPEPATWSMLGLGLFGLLAKRKFAAKS